MLRCCRKASSTHLSGAKVTRAWRQDRRATAHRADWYAREPAAPGTLLRQGSPPTTQASRLILIFDKTPKINETKKKTIILNRKNIPA